MRPSAHGFGVFPYTDSKICLSKRPEGIFRINFLKKHPSRLRSNELSAQKMYDYPLEELKSLREASRGVYGDLAIFEVFRSPYTHSNGPISLLKGPEMSFLSKTSEEMTGSDMVKEAAVLAVIIAVGPYATLAGLGACYIAYDKAKKKFRKHFPKKKK